MEKLITVHAPGKVILVGEHAVVYGKKAIACSVSGKIQIELFQIPEKNDLIITLPNLFEESKDSQIKFSLDMLRVNCQNLENEDKSNNKWQQTIKNFIFSTCPEEKLNNNLIIAALSVFVSAYIKVVLEEGKMNYPSLSICVSSHNLPLGAGLGSSAAYCVCLVTAFMVYTKQIKIESHIGYQLDEVSLSKINDMAFEMEKLVHGSPSGIDNSVSTYGGAIAFTSGNLKRYSNFPNLDFLIVDSLTARSTKALVTSVRHKTEKFPKVMTGILQSIHELSEKAEEIFLQMLHCEDSSSSSSSLFIKLKELLTMNRHLLNCIGVGHPNLDSIYSLADKYGLTCKLTGAGGGGCAIILLDPQSKSDQIRKLQNEIASKGFTSWRAILGGGGVKVVHCDSRLFDLKTQELA